MSDERNGSEHDPDGKAGTYHPLRNIYQTDTTDSGDTDTSTPPSGRYYPRTGKPRGQNDRQSRNG